MPVWCNDADDDDDDDRVHTCKNNAVDNSDVLVQTCTVIMDSQIGASHYQEH